MLKNKIKKIKLGSKIKIAIQIMRVKIEIKNKLDDNYNFFIKG